MHRYPLPLLLHAPPSQVYVPETWKVAAFIIR
jgi:hypothetical protein